MKKNIYSIKFNSKGLIPTIAQEYKTNEVLMLAFMNKESLDLTIKTNFVHYFSRSRNRIWKKGETSNNVQEVIKITFDCDLDSILIKVKQRGPSCHTGEKNCFFYSLNRSSLNMEQET